MQMAVTDLELWQGVLAGDHDAWVKLVSRYQALVYTVVSRGGLSFDDAADCFQSTWIALYKNRHKLKDPSRLSAWLVTVSKREALRMKKQAGKTVEKIGEDMAPDPVGLPDEELERLQRQAQLEIAMNELNPRCRRVLEAFFYSPEHKTYGQIAESLGVEPNSLGPIRRRCLERLKKILLKNGYLEVRNDEKQPL